MIYVVIPSLLLNSLVIVGTMLAIFFIYKFTGLGNKMKKKKD